MNVLEKILEEIIDELKEEGIITDNERGNRAVEIICSHMDDIPNTSNKRLIDANTLDEEVRNFFLAITGNPKQATVVRECKESFRRMIDEQKTVYANDDWIPCCYSAN